MFIKWPHKDSTRLELGKKFDAPRLPWWRILWTRVVTRPAPDVGYVSEWCAYRYAQMTDTQDWRVK